MASIHNITTTPTPEVQDRLFKIANQVALKYAQDYAWSTWHSWDVVDQATSEGQAGLPATDRFFWHTTGRFGSSLGASTRIVTELQGELGSSPEAWGLREYAITVRLVTPVQRAITETVYHTVVAMCFDFFAIVINHALHPEAMKIPIGGEFYMSPYIHLSGSKGQERFKYFLEDGEYKLTMDNKQSTYELLHFSEIDIDVATNQLAIPSALEKRRVKGQEHILLPPRKHLSVRSLLDEKPQLIAAVPIDNKWLATTLRIQVDFANPTLTMQIPMADWAMKPQGKDWLQCLAHAPSEMRVTHTNAVILLQVELDAEKYESPYYELSALALLWALGEEFGLCYSVLNDMVHSVYRVWAPYRAKRTDVVVDSKMSDDEVSVHERADSMVDGIILDGEI